MNKKLFSSTFIIIIVVCGLTVTGVVRFGIVQASTEVGGILPPDTVWTKANSPYTLTGAVGVISGATLTIEAGVTVNLGDNYVQVNGTLRARGNTTDPIHFNEGSSSDFTNAAILFTDSSSDWNEATASGSIIENAIMNRSDIRIDSASPKIDNNTFNCRISTFGGSPLILNNIFEGGNGIVLYDSNETISGNIFSDTSQAIYVGGRNCAPLIEKNLIVKNGIGIIVPSSSGVFSPTIRNNTIAYNTEAIGIAGGGNPSPIIIYNNIYGSSDYNFRLAEIRNNVNATYNWWGTTDTQAINRTIYDFKKDFNLGTVNFLPFLNAPNLQAPQLPTYTIAASANAGGSISPSGNVSVGYGGSQTFNVTANSGYQLVNVTMDGKLATPPYTFTNVVAGHTISATFQQTPVVPEIFPSWVILTPLTMATLIGTVTLRRKNKN